MLGRICSQSNSVTVKILISSSCASFLDSSSLMLMSSPLGEIGGISSGAAQRWAFLATKFPERVSKSGRSETRSFSSFRRDEIFEINFLNERLEASSTLSSIIAENIPWLKVKEETNIACRTPEIEGGWTNVPVNSGWNFVGHALITTTPNSIKTFTTAPSSWSSLSLSATTLDFFFSDTKVNGTW